MGAGSMCLKAAASKTMLDRCPRVRSVEVASFTCHGIHTGCAKGSESMLNLGQ
jgi:hypothetical protein